MHHAYRTIYVIHAKTTRQTLRQTRGCANNCTTPTCKSRATDRHWGSSRVDGSPRARGGVRPHPGITVKTPPEALRVSGDARGEPHLGCGPAWVMPGVLYTRWGSGRQPRPGSGAAPHCAGRSVTAHCPKVMSELCILVKSPVISSALKANGCADTCASKTPLPPIYNEVPHNTTCGTILTTSPTPFI